MNKRKPTSISDMGVKRRPQIDPEVRDRLAQTSVEPNQQQRRQAVYLRPQWEAGVDRAIISVTENRLRELEFLGVLSARQREAGERFEADYWLVFPSTSPRDSLDQTPRGEDHETEAAAEARSKASKRLAKAKEAAGQWYPALRDCAAYRMRVKAAAAVLPGLLDKLADIYRLP